MKNNHQLVRAAAFPLGLNSIIRATVLSGALALALTTNFTSAQTSASVILIGIERITDTGIDAPSIFQGAGYGVSFPGNFRKYRREINLVGTINGTAAIPSTKTNKSTDYNTGIVDQSDATLSSRFREITGEYFNNAFSTNDQNFITMVGFTTSTTLSAVSGRLVIKEASYESQRLANRAVILVFPRSTQTFPINGEPYVMLTPTPNPPGSAKWTNLSTRVFAGTDDNSLIVGFVVAGNIPKSYLVRVVGPSLGQFGLTGFMPDPRFQLFASGAATPVMQNDDWGGGQSMVSVFSSVGAFGMSSPSSKDAAAIVTLAPGGYSVVVNATSTNAGVALVEVYEVP